MNLRFFENDKGFYARGQTLIETMAAAFMLVMGVTAAVGLAIYAFNASTNITKQIIATGLAREGIEAIKNMRDTNWLNTPLATNCYNFVSGTTDASCYFSDPGDNWLKPAAAAGYDITQPADNKYMRLNIDASSGNKIWSTGFDTGNWGLDFDPDLTCGANFCGFYGVNNINLGSANGSSDYYRQIVLLENEDNQYSRDEYHRLQVESRVWWADKKCPRTPTWPGVGLCAVVIKTNLTNWKDYTY